MTGPGKSRRGNVLIASFFIAVFLFFLCTAMVFDARQSLFLSFHTGNRLRALNLARGAANFALNTIKKTPEWETMFTGGKKWQNREEDGAYWEVWVERYRDTGNTGYFWLIKGRGYALGKMAAYNILLEEIRYPANTLFMYGTDGRLMFCSYRYRWMDFNYPPTSDAFLAASDGPLFTFENSRPVNDPMPLVNDFAYHREQKGYYEIDDINRTPPPTEDTHLIWLDLTETSADWRPIPDPRRQGATLYRHDEAMVGTAALTGDDAQDHSLIDNAREILRDDFGSYDVITQPVTGAALNVYVPTGTALAADGNLVYCHALHYYYKPSYMKNNYHYEDEVDPVTGRVLRRLVFTPDFFPPAVYERAPAVLCYSIDSGQWTLMVDRLSGVTGSYRDTPTREDGNDPLTDTIAFCNGKVYAQRAGPGGEPTNIIINMDPPITETTSPGVSRGIFAYNKSLLFHQVVDQTPDGWPIVGLGSLSPNAALSVVTPETSYDPPESGTVFVHPECRYNHSLIGTPASCPSGGVYMQPPYANNAVAVKGQDIFALGRYRRTLIPGEGKSYLDPFTADYLSINTIIESMVLYHYDGTSWQCLPWDTWRLAVSVNPVQMFPDRVTIPSDAGPYNFNFLSPGRIAAARYRAFNDIADRVYRPIAVNQETE
jgi:hypothetical protein